MNFDFQKQFAAYSNEQLLAMLMLEHQYQPEAIAAVRALLESRSVTDTDRERAAAAVAPKPVKKLPDSWAPGDDIFSGEEHWHHDGALTRNIRMTIIAAGAVVLLRLYNQFKMLLWGSGRSYAGSYLDALLNLLLAACAIAGCIFLWKRNPWGWRLLAGWATASILACLTSFIALMRFELWTFALSMIVQLMLLGTCALLLSGQAMRDVYKADRSVIWKSLFAGVVLIGCGLGIAVLMFR